MQNRKCVSLCKGFEADMCVWFVYAIGRIRHNSIEMSKKKHDNLDALFMCSFNLT